ncbi:MAG: PEP-CTERM sorting domain-containing protein [Deferrisomatales bacterium]|nr:PEP-CTERM sorting domain-containing protein [Deferrisomatales bacterium]
MRMDKRFSALIMSVLLVASASQAWAVVYGGIDFPQGPSSFADAVELYNPSYSGGNVPTAASYMDPIAALGTPNYVNPNGSVSLGSGGLIQLLFVNNLLTNSGGTGYDLHIFEIGPDVEDTFVAIRPTAATAGLLGSGWDANNDGFFEIGRVFGATSSIDIDSIFSGYGAGVLQFSAVQLIDDPNEGSTSGSTVGADIDAVGAIASVRQNVVPEPGTLLLLGSGLVGLAGYGRKRRKA